MDLPLLLGVDDEGVVVNGVADRAARAWLAGGLVGLPTETVYGLAADAQDADAVARIYEAKGRPADHPLIVHVQGPQALAGWSAGPNPAAERLVARFWPGALTVVVARSARAGDFLTGGQDTVALRCPDHPVARACLEALARLSGDPSRGVAAPSANRFGRVSPTRAGDVLAEVGPAMDPARDLVLDGGPCAIGVESTIVDCTATPPRVLRLGAISQEQIDAVLAADAVLAVEAVLAGGVGAGAQPGVVPGPSLTEPGDVAGGEVRAPGTLESHYAPLARMLLVEPGHASAGDLMAAVERALTAGRPAPGRVGHDPFGLSTLEGPETARITPDAAVAGHAVGLIAPSSVSSPEGWTRLESPDTPDEYARSLYAALRQADALRLAAVVAVLPDPREGPLALAVRDRLSRAAHES